MVLRTARRGKNAGGQFWGCSNYPACKGAVAADEPASPAIGETGHSPDTTTSNQRPVEPVHWRDALPRDDYYSEYVSIGAVPGFAVEQLALQDPRIRRMASQALLLSKRSQLRDVSEEQKALSSIIQKLLTRGKMPLSTLRVEEAVARLSSVAEHVAKLDERNIEVGWRWSSKPPRGLSRELAGAYVYKSLISEEDVATLTNDILGNVLDGDNEQYFFSKWLTRTLGRDALHWITPQAELDLILYLTEFIGFKKSTF